MAASSNWSYAVALQSVERTSIVDHVDEHDNLTSEGLLHLKIVDLVTVEYLATQSEVMGQRGLKILERGGGGL
jgi:hypothetical protein